MTYNMSDIPDDLRQYFVRAEIGLEATPEAFIAELVAVFREVRRVLRDDGTLWVNIGDSYGASSGDTMSGFNARYSGTGLDGGKQAQTAASARSAGKVERTTGTKPKDLIGVPWMLAFALRSAGWYLRQDIIWSKPNPMPESVRDRCTKAHEYLFLLSKSAKYYYDAGAIAEAVSPSSISRLSQDVDGQAGSARVPGKTNGNMKAVGGSETRNKRSVWTVATQPFSGAHFATFPPALIEPCILAGCPEFTCPNCGIALDDKFVSHLRSGTNGNDLSPLRNDVSEGSVADGQEPLLQPQMYVGRAPVGNDSLRDLWKDSSAGSEKSPAPLLQQDVREPRNRRQPGNHEGVDDNVARIPGGDGQGSSERVDLRLCDGTPEGDGGGDWSITESGGSCSSQEQRQARQSTGKPGVDEQGYSRQIEQGQAPTGQSDMPLLPNSSLPEQCCPNCKSRLNSDRLRPGVVLDPFGGAGTTGLVADRLQRNAILIELNPAYAAIASARITDDAPLFGAAL